MLGARAKLKGYSHGPGLVAMRHGMGWCNGKEEKIQNSDKAIIDSDGPNARRVENGRQRGERDRGACGARCMLQHGMIAAPSVIR